MSFMVPEKQIKVGLIGCGRIGKIHLNNLANKFKDITLKTVVDIEINEELNTIIKQLGIPKLSDDPNDIFNDDEIEAVFIASSTNTHAKFIQEAAKNGKHVFCEKPLDVDVPRIKNTLNIVQDSNIKLMIGFNRRFDPNFNRIQELVIKDKIGIPQIIKITSRDPSPPPIEYIKVSGGIFMDMTIHDWDMARFQVGSEVQEVYANGSVLVDLNIGKAGDIDTAIAVLKFENGAMGIIDNSRQAVYGYDQRLEIFGSKGCLIADNELSNTVQMYTEKGTFSDNIPYFFLDRYTPSYAIELKYFFDCLKNNVDPKPNGEDGLKAVLIALAAQKSFEEKRPVKISEISSKFEIK